MSVDPNSIINSKKSIMMTPNTSAPALSVSSTTPNIATNIVESKSELNPTQKEGWNQYVKFLDNKGLIGDERLNHKFGVDTFNKWASSNKQYELEQKNLPQIVDELSNQKNQVLTGVTNKKIKLNTPASEYMTTVSPNLMSKNTAHPGVNLTQQTFTTFKENLLNAKGDILKTKERGFVQPKETFSKTILQKTSAPVIKLKINKDK